jgi:hypothetical protein
MSHDLTEKVAGLASRVNNLAVHHAGSDSRKLMELQDRLAKLELVAIVRDLKAEHADYKAAIRGLNQAIDSIGDARREIDKVSKVIRLVAKAASLAEKAVKTAVL